MNINIDEETNKGVAEAISYVEDFLGRRADKVEKLLTERSFLKGLNFGLNIAEKINPST